MVKRFTGVIKQFPPVRSAIKRQERERTIYYLEILEIDGQDVLFKVGCEAGTYIRTLCVDIGKALGVGAHMAQLVRTKAGSFLDKDMISLHDLYDAYEENEIKKVVLPMEEGVKHLAKVYVVDSAIDSLCHGADLYVIGVAKYETEIDREDLVAVMSLKGELIGIGYAEMRSKEMEKRERGTAIRIKSVFMERKTYACQDR